MFTKEKATKILIEVAWSTYWVVYFAAPGLLIILGLNKGFGCSLKYSAINIIGLTVMNFALHKIYYNYIRTPDKE